MEALGLTKRWHHFPFHVFAETKVESFQPLPQPLLAGGGEQHLKEKLSSGFPY